jgi:hypothetical protein
VIPTDFFAISSSVSLWLQALTQLKPVRLPGDTSRSQGMTNA